MALEDFSMQLADVGNSLWGSIVNIIPGIIGAIIVLVAGYIIGAIVGHVVRKILVKTKVIESIVKKAKLEKSIGAWDIPHLLGLLIKWYIFVLFLLPASSLINLYGLAVFLDSVALWIPSLIAAILIALIGFIAAEYVLQKVIETKSKGAYIIGGVAKVVILIITAIIALSQIGIDVSIAEKTFLIILAGIMLAIGLAFGLGAKDFAKDVINRMKKKV